MYIHIRTGGDEFVMALKCGCAAFVSKLGVFFTEMKREINGLGVNIKQFMQSESEWSEAKHKLESAKDRNGNRLDLSTVGISTGVFVSNHYGKDKDWLSKADKLALEHAKSLNLPNKNRTAIYCEESASLISDEKTEKCLENGVWEGRK